jgi:hypothetical protein
MTSAFVRITALCLLFLAHTVMAQSDPAAVESVATGILPLIENGKRIYTVEQFARFAPQSAADVVAQIPGFSISGVSNDRGLGQASQNVLINGQRITGKGNDAMSVLRRIPVESVRRLEIVDGASLDISGLSGDVLNVVAEQGIQAITPGARNSASRSGRTGRRARSTSRSPASVTSRWGFDGTVSAGAGGAVRPSTGQPRTSRSGARRSRASPTTSRSCRVRSIAPTPPARSGTSMPASTGNTSHGTSPRITRCPESPRPPRSAPAKTRDGIPSLARL